MNQSDAQPSPNYVTCPCQHCDGGIEFDANQLDAAENTTVPCPHCGLETIIFAPEQKVPPVISDGNIHLCQISEVKPEEKQSSNIIVPKSDVPSYDMDFIHTVFCGSKKDEAGKEKWTVNRQTSSLKEMNPEQTAFFLKLVDSIKNKTYLSVADQPDYLRYYLREKYRTFDRENLERLYDELLCLAVPYEKVGDGIFWRPKWWSYDCLLALESYDKYFEVTKPANIYSINTHFANQKCNVRYFLGMPASGVDLLQMYGEHRNRITKLTKEHPLEFENILEAVFLEEEKKNGSWFEHILADSNRKDYGLHLFACFHFARRSKIPCYCFYQTSEKVANRICNAFREAENRLRQLLGEKNVGEQWDDETRLFYEIKRAFPNTEVIHHGKPEWLGRQHLDIWIPEFRVGIEYHGVQHFQPIGYLGGEKHLITQKERDLRKSKLCKANGVELIVVTDETPIEAVMGKIKERMASPTPLLDVAKIKSPVAETVSSRMTQPDANKSTVDTNLAELWLKLVKAVGRVSPYAFSYLSDAHPVSFEKNVFTIGFAPKCEDHLGLVDNARNHKLLAMKLAELGYSNMKIKFIKTD